MPRPRQRACLQDGLSLNLNRLARRGFIRPGAATGPVGINWTDSYSGEVRASAIITADMSGPHEGWLRIQSVKADHLDQRIILVACPRHFGGSQWFFMCLLGPAALCISRSNYCCRRGHLIKLDC